MNLWAKSLRQLVIFTAALFFFSCEDESSFIGFPNPNEKFKVSFVQLDLPSSVFTLDSVATDNVATMVSNAPYNAVGSYNDPLLGLMKTESYLQMAPSTTTKLEANAVFDSLTIQLRLNFYNYGFNGDNQFKFNVHEITGEALDLDTLERRYYFNSTIAYSTDPLAEVSVSVNKEQLDTLRQDTVLISGRLADQFGLRLFNLALNDPDATFSDRQLFTQEIKGLVITPTETNGIIGFNPLSLLSKVVLHYHRLNDKNETDTLQRNFVFSNAPFGLNPNFTNYSTDRSATEFAPITQPYQGYAPTSGLRAIQNGSPLVTKIDLSEFYNFADEDSVKNIIINDAELVIENVQSSDGLAPHNSLMLLVMNNNNDRLARISTTMNEALQEYFIRQEEGSSYYYVGAERASSPATLSYNSDEKKYSVFIDSFVQSLFRGAFKEDESLNENRIIYLAVFPASPILSGTVNRTVFNAGDVKLRINYTQPAAVAKNN